MTKQERDAIKNLFRGYKKMSRAMRLTLESLDLHIADCGKHYKVSRCDGVGGTCTIPKTSSDHRAGLNVSFYIIQLLDTTTVA